MWSQLARLKGQTLLTLGQGHPFEVVHVSDDTVAIRTSAGKIRPIPRKHIEAAWEQLATTGALTWQDIHDSHSSFNPTYVAAMLSRLPGVVTELRPIQLRLKRA